MPHPSSFPRKPATVRGSAPAVAQGTSGAFERVERPLPSFPRKWESKKNNMLRELPCKRESAGLTDGGCRRWGGRSGNALSGRNTRIKGLLLSLGALVFWASATASPLSGEVVVVSGDTLEVAGERVRLRGIDAPGLGQICRRTAGIEWRCGLLAKLELARHIDGRAVTCDGDEHDELGQRIAICEVGGSELGAWLVERGWALASGDAHAASETEARGGGSGAVARQLHAVCRLAPRGRPPPPRRRRERVGYLRMHRAPQELSAHRATLTRVGGEPTAPPPPASMAATIRGFTEPVAAQKSVAPSDSPDRSGPAGSTTYPAENAGR